MMKLEGTNLTITDDNRTICTDKDQAMIQDIKQRGIRPDGYDKDFFPVIEQGQIN